MIQRMKIALFIMLFGLLPFSAQATLYFSKPESFKPKVEVAGIYVEYKGKFLMLHRQDFKSQGNRWGIPAGKLDGDETPIEGAVRETREETGIDLANSNVTYLDKVYLKHPAGDCVFYMFKADISGQPDLVKIKFNEHKGFTWVTPEEALKMNLMFDQDTCIKHIYNLDNEL